MASENYGSMAGYFRKCLHYYRHLSGSIRILWIDANSQNWNKSMLCCFILCPNMARGSTFHQFIVSKYTLLIVNSLQFAQIYRVCLKDLFTHLFAHVFTSSFMLLTWSRLTGMFFDLFKASGQVLGEASHESIHWVILRSYWDHTWLVVSTLLKNMNFNWDDDIPNISGKIKNVYITTNQWVIANLSGSSSLALATVQIQKESMRIE